MGIVAIYSFHRVKEKKPFTPAVTLPALAMDAVCPVPQRVKPLWENTGSDGGNYWHVTQMYNQIPALAGNFSRQKSHLDLSHGEDMQTTARRRLRRTKDYWGSCSLLDKIQRWAQFETRVAKRFWQVRLRYTLCLPTKHPVRRSTARNGPNVAVAERLRVANVTH